MDDQKSGDLASLGVTLKKTSIWLFFSKSPVKKPSLSYLWKYSVFVKWALELGWSAVVFVKIKTIRHPECPE